MAQCVIFDEDDAPAGSPTPCRRIVGVYRDLAVMGLQDEVGLSVAFPNPPDRRGIRGIVVRADGDPATLLPHLRQATLSVSPELRYVDVAPLSERFDRLLRPWRLGATMFTAFGVLALIVSCVGLYSVLSFAVAQRQRELGIRLALGASRRDLIGMVMGQAARLVGGGLVLGAAVALGAGRFVEGLLFGVSATDLTVYGMVILTLGASGALAALVPARRATAINPIQAIQAE